MPVTEQGKISENSRKIARNTFFLYFRMLLMMFIGLFTSRVILNTLGADDYGIYNIVGGVVVLFTFISNSIALNRFMSHALGTGDKVKVKKIYSSSVIIQMMISAMLVIFVETFGLWMLHHKLVIPPDRMGAAMWVLQCSMGILVATLMAAPSNAAIIAHERMDIYAWISILEAVLKLSVAVLLWFSGFDKLKTYAVLMLCVTLIIRATYATLCKMHFEESRGRLVWDNESLKEMAGFSFWCFFGSSGNVFSTQGVNIVSNLFFGVGVNTARGIVTQVEGMVKQFVTNVTTAFNPQITKSYASGDKAYSFSIVVSACKYTYLILLVFMIPLVFEADLLLGLWLKNVPYQAEIFVRLAVLCLFTDLLFNPVHILQLATGDIRKYYIAIGIMSYLTVPLVWLVFRLGAPAYCAYLVYFTVYLAMGVIRLRLIRTTAGFPVKDFMAAICRCLLVTLCSFPLPLLLGSIMEDGFFRLAVICATAWLGMAASTWMIALDETEKAFVKGIIRKSLHKLH